MLAEHRAQAEDQRLPGPEDRTELAEHRARAEDQRLPGPGNRAELADHRAQAEEPKGQDSPLNGLTD